MGQTLSEPVIDKVSSRLVPFRMRPVTVVTLTLHST